METRKHYRVAEQEMVIGLYEESGKTLKEFCGSEGLEPKKLERWLRASKARQTEESVGVRFREVEEKPVEKTAAMGAGRYRLGFGNGAWLEMEGSFEVERVRVLYFDGSGTWLCANRHAPQCAYWFIFENPLPLSSAFREGMRAVRIGRR